MLQLQNCANCIFQMVFVVMVMVGICYAVYVALQFKVDYSSTEIITQTKLTHKQRHKGTLFSLLF